MHNTEADYFISDLTGLVAELMLRFAVAVTETLNCNYRHSKKSKLCTACALSQGWTHLTFEWHVLRVPKVTHISISTSRASKLHDRFDSMLTYTLA